MTDDGFVSASGSASLFVCDQGPVWVWAAQVMGMAGKRSRSRRMA
jgi:hypothetical protein